MTRLRVLLSRLLEAMFRRRRDTRLDEEIQTHLDLLTDEFVARGLSRADAVRAARREFGGVDKTRLVVREQRGLPLVDTLMQDVRFAVRLLHRDRSFSLTAVLVLALGIGVNNMVFAILNAHTLRGLPIRDAAQVAVIATLDDRNRERGLSRPEFEELRDSSGSFAALVAITEQPVVISGDGQPADRLGGLFVSGDAFAAVGGRTAIGRALNPSDERPGAPAVAIISTNTWTTRYGGREGVLGQAIAVNSIPATIVGVFDERSGFPATADIWVPLPLLTGLAGHTRADRNLRVFGRLRDGAGFDESAAEVRAFGERLALAHTETNKSIRVHAVPINERYFGRWNDTAWIAFMSAGFLVVLISAANVANLMLGRTSRRAREIAVRSSLGASRMRLVRQLLIEGCVLAAIGGAVGLGLAAAGVRLFRSAIPENALPYWVNYSPDARVITALVAVSFVTVLVFALLPAVHASRTDINRTLKDGGRTGTGGRGSRRWTTAFLAAEFALAIVLMAQVAASLRQIDPPSAAELGLTQGQLVTASLTLAGDRYRTPQQRLELIQQLRGRLDSMADVSSTSIASAAPFMGKSDVRVEVAGRPPVEADAQAVAATVAIGPRYFETLGVPLNRGRELTEADGSEAIVVNEAFVEQFLTGVDAIGQRIATVPAAGSAVAPAWATIVGVAPDVPQGPRGTDPLVYTPYGANPAATAALLVRMRTPGDQIGARLKDAVFAIDPNLPLYRVQSMNDVIWQARWNGRISRQMIYTLSLIAMMLAVVGLYAVTMHAVSQRTQEIGVRMALGARPRQIVTLVGRRALTQLGLGFAAGAVCTRLWEGFIPSGDADIRATDPATMALVGGGADRRLSRRLHRPGAAGGAARSGRSDKA